VSVLPMYENEPGTKDLIYHTAKHFLGPDEASRWDCVPAGSLSAREARVHCLEGGRRPPPVGSTVDPTWWWPPWRSLAFDAHDRGYRPRYELLLKLAGDPSGPQWEPSELTRRLTEHLGFRLLVQPSGTDWQLITAFFSRTFRGAEKLQEFAPALRAFAARRNCPPEGTGSVPGGESRS